MRPTNYSSHGQQNVDVSVTVSQQKHGMWRMMRMWLVKFSMFFFHVFLHLELK